MSAKTNTTPAELKAQWLNGNGIYDRFAIPRSLLRSLVEAGRVRGREVQTEWGVMKLYNIADCAAFVNGETGDVDLTQEGGNE